MNMQLIDLKNFVNLADYIRGRIEAVSRTKGASSISMVFLVRCSVSKVVKPEYKIEKMLS